MAVTAQRLSLEEIECQINEAVRGVQHASKSSTKYHLLEVYLSELLNVTEADIYCAHISKAGNVRPRLGQSANSLRASKLVLLASLPAHEPMIRLLEQLRRYLEERSTSGVEGAVAEALVLVRNDDSWRVHAIVIPETGYSTPIYDAFSKRVDVLVESYVPMLRKLDSGSLHELSFEVIEDRNIAIDELPFRNHPCAFLVREQWDDDGLQTTFHLHVQFPSRADPKRTLTHDVGEVKIIERAMRAGPTRLRTLSFKSLNEVYCSLGQNYSYYENIKQLPADIEQALLTGLRDAVYNSTITLEFESEYGFTASLARSGQAARALKDAPNLFTKHRQTRNDTVRTIEYHARVGGSNLSVKFEFDDEGQLPGRINAVIGYNGVGKTQLLANLAVVATVDLERRRDVAPEYGELVNSERTRFSSVIAISYSAFDTFTLPADLWTGESAEIAAEKAGATGEVVGYAYCGLRLAGQGPGTRRRLKSIDKVTDDFMMALKRARSLEKQAIFRDAWQLIRSEPSFARLGVDTGDRDALTREGFEQLSAGHKIVLNIVAQVISRASPGSLVLIDEPECHLHPSLLSALIRSLSQILSRLDSHAIIATHSPVILQEIPSRFVKIIQRYGDTGRVVEPNSETFGENVGFLTNNVFHLDSSRTDFHSILERLATKLTMDEMEDLFQDGMSAQARAYVLSLKRTRG